MFIKDLRRYFTLKPPKTFRPVFSSGNSSPLTDPETTLKQVQGKVQGKVQGDRHKMVSGSLQQGKILLTPLSFSYMLGRIVRKEHRPRNGVFNARLLNLLMEPLYMVQGRDHVPRKGFYVIGRAFPSPFSEHKHVKQGIPHKPVSSVHAPRYLAGRKKPLHTGPCIAVYLKPSVLIMKCRIDKHRLSAYINVIALKLYVFGREFLSYGSIAVKYVYHRGIQPGPDPSGGRGYALAGLAALPSFA